MRLLIVSLLIGLIAGCQPNISTTSSGTSKPPALDRKAMGDLKQIAIAYHNYYGQHNKGPQYTDDLLPFVENDRALINAVKSGVYVVFMNVDLQNLPEGSNRTILGFAGTVPNNGGAVIFADGTVASLTKEEFAATAKAGR